VPMRRLAWTALGLFALGFGAGLVAQYGGVPAFAYLAGSLFLAAGVAGLALLPWRRLVPGLEPMPGLFPKPGEGERWCDRCGRTTREGPCVHCGHAPRPRKGRVRAKGDAGRKGSSAQRSGEGPAGGARK